MKSRIEQFFRGEWSVFLIVPVFQYRDYLPIPIFVFFGGWWWHSDPKPDWAD